METVADRIKLIRKAHHLSQVEFAGILGISQTHISKVESGKDNPSNKILASICSEFEVNIEWLKEGVGPIEAQQGQCSEINEIVVKLKTYLLTAPPMESDLCAMFLKNIPDLFQCARTVDSELDNMILLEIFDLLDNVFKLNQSLNSTVNLILGSNNIQKEVDGVFWIKERYEKKILDNITHLFNLYLGRGQKA